MLAINSIFYLAVSPLNVFMHIDAINMSGLILRLILSLKNGIFEFIYMVLCLCRSGNPQQKPVEAAVRNCKLLNTLERCRERNQMFELVAGTMSDRLKSALLAVTRNLLKVGALNNASI